MPEHQPAHRSSNAEQQWERISEQFQEQCAAQTRDFTHLMEQIGDEFSQYCRRRPRVVAVGLLAFGFLVGWKMKP